MDHDSAVPAQMFFLPEACSTSHFILPPFMAFALGIHLVILTVHVTGIKALSPYI